jgi:hypothetical protein
VPHVPAWLAVAVIVAVLVVPMLVALVALRTPPWHPILDMAQTEIRVRDVGTTASPLIGLPGRIGEFGNQGSHPGPLSFWALAPAYRLFGATSWALQVASVALQSAALAAIAWIAYRRGGLRLVLGVAAVTALLLRAYGAGTLTEAWNPHLPLLFWVVLMLAVWSVISDDLAMLPVAVFAGSFCAQTHVPYLGLSVGLLAFAVGMAAWRAYRRKDRDARHRFLRWLLIATGVGVIVWLLPVLQQFGDRGNFTLIWETFRDPTEAMVGPRRGIEALLVDLNPWTLLTEHVAERPQTATSGSILPGVVVLAAWAVSIGAALRLRHRPLLRLDLVLAVALALAVVSTSRIFGVLWFYLVLWAWGIQALILLAIGWTTVVALTRRLDGSARDRVLGAATAGAATVVLVVTTVFAIDAASSDSPNARLSRTLGEIARSTATALASGSAPGGGRDGRYAVTWDDPVSIGAPGWGLMNELDRRGFEVGVPLRYEGGAPPDQVMEPDEPTAEVHVVVGSGIETWKALPGVEEVARYDPRTPAERAEYEQLRARAVADLERAGLSDLVRQLKANQLNAVAGDPRVPERTRERLVRLHDLGLPTVVFVGPPARDT